MKRKIIALLLVVLMIMVAGCSCGKKEEVTEPTTKATVPTTVTTAPTEPEKVGELNPLTGEMNLRKGAVNNRPIAIMVNNLSTAQTVQTGVGNADIVYETEVEGGITRLMAVYQDVAKAKRVGTVRSARYVYIDLAMGHNAVYVHHGADNVYAGPHLSDINRIEINPGNYGERISNGLSWEHTLYTTSGKSLLHGAKSKFNMTKDNSSTWQDFASEDEEVKLSGGDANYVSVPFSYQYITKFVYDKDSGKYTRTFAGVERKDYFTGKKTKVKNVVVLLTNIGYYSNGKHRNVSLSGGSGYYVSGGKYEKINWSKGSASSPFKFTKADGSALKMNAGKTWVCIASSSYSQPKFG